MSVLTLADYNHKRVTDTLLVGNGPLAAFHTRQYKVRDVVSARDFLLGLVTGDYMKHVEEFMALLTSADALSAAGFNITLFDGDPSEEKIANVISADDEHAHLFGTVVLAFVSERVQRGIHFFTFPVKFIGVMGTADFRKDLAVEWREDSARFATFDLSEGKSADAKLVSDRSPMRYGTRSESGLHMMR